MAQQNGGFWSLFRAKLLIVVLLGFGLYLIVPPVYWHFVGEGSSSKHPACPACVCDCEAENFANSALSSLSKDSSLAGLDCGNDDGGWRNVRDVSKEEQLREQLELQRAVADENKERADTAYLDAKKLTSQYQKEAEKCNIGMETSEEARERAEIALAEEKKKSALWRRRAKSLGWTEDGSSSSKSIGNTASGELTDMTIKVISTEDEELRRSSVKEEMHDPAELGIGSFDDGSRYKKKSTKYKRKQYSVPT